MNYLSFRTAGRRMYSSQYLSGHLLDISFHKDLVIIHPNPASYD